MWVGVSDSGLGSGDLRTGRHGDRGVKEPRGRSRRTFKSVSLWGRRSETGPGSPETSSRPESRGRGRAQGSEDVAGGRSAN